jgi:hypothetical protein
VCGIHAESHQPRRSVFLFLLARFLFGSELFSLGARDVTPP